MDGISVILFSLNFRKVQLVELKFNLQLIQLIRTIQQKYQEIV